jgi:hypothetical protein
MTDLTTVPECACKKRFGWRRECGREKKMRSACTCHCHTAEIQKAVTAQQPAPTYTDGPLSRDCVHPGCGAKIGEFCKTATRAAHMIRMRDTITKEQQRHIESSMRGVRKFTTRKRKAA